MSLSSKVLFAACLSLTFNGKIGEVVMYIVAAN